jgi:hypothetical protein
MVAIPVLFYFGVNGGLIDVDFDLSSRKLGRISDARLNFARQRGMFD